MVKLRPREDVAVLAVYLCSEVSDDCTSEPPEVQNRNPPSIRARYHAGELSYFVQS